MCNLIKDLKEKYRMNSIKSEILCWKIFIIENKNKIKDLSCWEKSIRNNEEKLKLLER